jgi:hypothetical protein
MEIQTKWKGRQMGVPHKKSRQNSTDTGWRGFGMWITLFWIKGICFYIRIVKPFKPFFMLLLDLVLEESIGKRVRCISMENDPNPIEPNTIGTIYHYGCGILNVEWDNGRTLGLIVDKDKFEILEETRRPHHYQLVLRKDVLERNLNS